MNYLLSVITAVLLSGCVSSQVYAPVQDVNLHHIGKTFVHYVQPGETLYAVAWRYEKDFRELAQLNKLKSPYILHPGQSIVLSGVVKGAAKKKSVKKFAKRFVPAAKGITLHQNKMVKYRAAYHPAKTIHHWLWPTKGSIFYHFSRLNKGIDISGNYHQKIVASADGTVVYAGNGIRGYGNLLILKHNNDYFSAYAYNSQLFAKTGRFVKAGQTIANMGRNMRGHAMLHFEIRKRGKPVNPLKYLR